MSEPTIHVGFTGTRWGMTMQQKDAVHQMLKDLAALVRPGRVVAHHGDCVGADSNFHDLARDVNAYTIGHPPTSLELRANRTFDQVRPPLGHLARNRRIVLEAQVMIATPFESTRQTRGGTWYTIDHARKVGRKVVVVLPDGSVMP